MRNKLLPSLVAVALAMGSFITPINAVENTSQPADSAELNLAFQEDVTQMFIPLSDPEEIPEESIEEAPEVIGNQDLESGIDPEAIQGSDDRYLAQNPFVRPNLQIVFIKSYYKIDTDKYVYFVGTGTLVGNKTVLTAGHMLYSKEYGYVDALRVYVGYSGNSYRACYAGNTGIVLPGYKKHVDEMEKAGVTPQGDDIGIITMNGTPGSQYGYLNAVTTGAVGQWFTTFGYPGDKIEKDSITHEITSVTQWGADGQITSVANNSYRHTADTTGGQSGSPLINNKNEIIAVHTGGRENVSNVASIVSNGIVELISSSETGYYPIYRLYNPNTGEHFYTAAFDEADSLVGFGWKAEGVAWSTGSTGAPVYRLYNENTGEHHYTVNATELNVLVQAGWKKEMIAWYAPISSNKPVYRLYNPQKDSFNHHYTTSSVEKDALISYGWKDEKIAWYAY